MEFFGITKDIIERAKLNKKRIVLPESSDLRILKAADIISKEDIADITLVGSLEEIEFLCKVNNINIDFTKVKVENPEISEKREFYINSLYELRKNKGLSMIEAIGLISDNIYFATMMVKVGDCDGLVSGAIHSTAETLRPALKIIKAAEGVQNVSSFFLIDIPNCDLDSNGKYIFSDCGLIENPTEQQLADIAIASANSYRCFINNEPKVAMLSYSTKGSAKSESIDKVCNAVKLVKEANVDFEIDGEMQLDAAIIKEIAAIKAPSSTVAGHANVLIFPNIESGNIGYKLVQRFAHATAIGPLTQGLAKPVNDLSRGCNVEEIIGAVAVTCIQV
ncbi:MAG: phosphate acetyltransferase [Clostridia bacterium]|nr:phosphate acetyltransferase [Clostridia bacterium]MDD4386845.1 phosphate acetyltransferase [Clostridia bacterium]